MTAPDVVVVGGGIIGQAVAWRAAQAGRRVVLADPDPGGGASYAAAGMLAPVTEASVAEAPLTRLGLASARAWPAFAAELADLTGVDVGLRGEGTVAVAFDDDDRRHLEELRRVHVLLQLDSTWLPSRDCRKLEPYLSPRIRGGLHVAGDVQVDPRAVLRALTAGGARAGVEVRRQAVTRVIVDGPTGSVTGIELAGGDRVAAGAVVLAAGAWSGRLAGVPDEARPPVRPVKGDILRLHGSPADPVVTRTVRAHVQGRDVYLVPRRNGELVIGASVEDAGFNAAVRAGAVSELLQAAITVVPGVAELELVETMARLRPASPDNGPVLGPTVVPGLLVATGHYRNGVLLTPITADALLAALAGRELPAEAAPFTMARFGR